MQTDKIIRLVYYAIWRSGIVMSYIIPVFRWSAVLMQVCSWTGKM